MTMRQLNVVAPKTMQIWLFQYTCIKLSINRSSQITLRLLCVRLDKYTSSTLCWQLFVVQYRSMIELCEGNVLRGTCALINVVLKRFRVVRVKELRFSNFRETKFEKRKWHVDPLLWGLIMHWCPVTSNNWAPPWIVIRNTSCPIYRFNQILPPVSESTIKLRCKKSFNL